MKILKHRIIASTLGVVATVGFGFGVGQGQVAPRANPAPKAAGAGAAAGAVVPNLPPWTANHVAPQSFLATQPNIAAQGRWAEVISSTSRWVVVQTQEGQQFPIAADRIRQFLVRWPSSVSDLSPTSMVEATGMQTSNTSMMTDHIDIYEPDAQSLVSPTMQSVGGGGPGLTTQSATANFSFIDYSLLNFGAPQWTEQPNQGTTTWTEVPNLLATSGMLHVVGRWNVNNPVTLSGFGPTIMMVMPAPPPTGMSVTQVTLGAMSYVKKGDLVHLLPETGSARSLDVSQLVLYKKIPLRRFQP